jgi:hypothetical protein
MSDNLLIADIEAPEKSVKKPVERLNLDDCPCSGARVDAPNKIGLKTGEGRSITFTLIKPRLSSYELIAYEFRYPVRLAKMEVAR